MLKNTGGDADAAKQQFIDMIASSQIDRTRRPTLTVDPAWLKMSLASASKEVTKVLPTRQEKITYDLAMQSKGLYDQPVNEKAGRDMSRLYGASDKFMAVAEQYAKRYQ
jgi:hypothetical protein